MKELNENNYELDLDEMTSASGGKGVIAGLSAEELYDVLIRICQSSDISAAFQTAMDKYGATRDLIASCQNFVTDNDKIKMLASSLVKTPKV